MMGTMELMTTVTAMMTLLLLLQLKLHPSSPAQADHLMAPCGQEREW
jgi:hypothetical protein